MSEQKERPILFNGEMVRAILEGRKTVTRRALRNQMGNGWHIADPKHPMVAITSAHPKKGKFGLLIRREIYQDSGKFEYDVIVSPFGRPGDRLWVRESTERDDQTSGVVTLSRYCADKAPVLQSSCADTAFNGSVAHWNYPRDVRPSIHMLRTQCRILLEITDVRVERLQGITEDQARAEGITDGGCTCCGNSEPCGCDCPSPSAVDSFYHLWNSTGGDFDSNPWVWVVEFKRVDHLA